MDGYEDLFLVETKEYLQIIIRCLLEIEKNPASEHLAEMFRAVHSLKGMAGTMGYELIVGLAHEMETLLDQLQRGKVAVGPDCINLFLEAVDLLQLLTDNLHQQQDFSAEVVALQERLRLWQTSGKDTLRASVLPPQDEQQANTENFPQEGKHLLAWEELTNNFEKKTLVGALQQGKKIYQIYIRLRQNSLLKSVRVHMVLKVLEGVGEVVKAEPSLQALEEENFDREFFLLFAGEQQIESFRFARREEA